MSSIVLAVKSAAEKNRNLLDELSRTDHASTSLKQNALFIQDLNVQIAETDKELARLHRTTEDERKDHIKYSDSNVKRWMYKLGGSKGTHKFVAKQEKEEREFFEAWQKERSATDVRKELSMTLETAEQCKVRLENETQRHERAQAELDALYRSIFDGPTLEVPGEDDMEQAVQNARAYFNQTQAQLEADKKALELLRQAELSLKSANMNSDDALRRSRRDVYGGGLFTDIMERDALSNAVNCFAHALRQIEAARRQQPAIRPLDRVEIDQGHLVGDVLFDNVFSDLAQHERIMKSNMDMSAATMAFQRELKEQAQRTSEMEKRSQHARNDLEIARTELQRIRAEAFERFAGQEGFPPQYTT